MSAGVILAAVVLVGGGSCYLGPINMPPQISIIAPASLVRGVELVFEASVSDSDGDAVSVQWAHAPGACDGRTQPPAGTVWVFGDTHAVRSPDSDSSFCVWAAARDSHGAISSALPYSARPSDQGAVVELALTGEGELAPRQDLATPFRLYRQIRFDVWVNDPEGDPTALVEWSLPGAQLTECSQPMGESSRCLVPTQPGMFTVLVTVTDTGGTRSSARQTFRVAEDALPCLALTEPGLDAERVSATVGDPLPYSFRVLGVDDDGEPWPLLTDHEPTKFAWFRGSAAGELQPLNDTTNFYQLEQANHYVGEKVRVRVEIADRNEVRARKLLADCKDDICTSSPGCRQRMTWLIEYNK